MKHKLIGITEIALGWIKKYSLKYNMEDGSNYNYDLVTRNKLVNLDDIANKNNAISIVCYDKNRNFILLKEFRYAVNDYVIDFPAGLIDEGESLEEAANRELFEETGLSGKLITVLDGGFSSAGMTDEKVAVCLMEVEDVHLANKNNMDSNEDIDFIICDLFGLSNYANTSLGKVSNRIQYFMLGTLMR